jgi:Fur family zinc uptake transcriptional regulator
MPSPQAAGFPVPDHDHQPCVDGVVARAEAKFEQQGMRLTELRRHVLEEVASSHKAVGAYEVLERLARRDNRRLAPISVYRALDALVAAGLVHRLESRNAFFACHSAHASHRRHIVLACGACGTVVEMAAPEVFAGIVEAADAASFRVDQALVEVIGACEPCRGMGSGSE